MRVYVLGVSMRGQLRQGFVVQTFYQPLEANLRIRVVVDYHRDTLALATGSRPASNDLELRPRTPVLFVVAAFFVHVRCQRCALQSSRKILGGASLLILPRQSYLKY